MRRDVRKRNNQDDELNIKIIKYSGIGIAILAVIVFGLLIYSKNLNDEVKEGTLTGEQIANILNNTNSLGNTESASTEIGKSVNEVELELTEKNIISNNTTNSNNTKTNVSTNADVLTTNKITSNNTTSQTNSKIEEKDKTEEATVELKFDRPVEGEVVRDFAVDNLIYSDTLQEWTTHTGIDIKAEKTTVVKSAEAGTVKTIKNDPRYGLTVVIEHQNGFESIYSSLLTAEFITVGEEIKQGSTIATVGNTATFEIADTTHLHFEIKKDGQNVDPNIYMK